MKHANYIVIAGMSLALLSCKSNLTVTGVEGFRHEITHELDAQPDQTTANFLRPYKHEVDSVMNAKMGESAQFMQRGGSESLLGNLMTTVLRQAAAPYLGGKPADIGLMNNGGMRSNLTKGDITLGDLYDISPFDNRLCILRLTGNELNLLFRDLALYRMCVEGGAMVVAKKDGSIVSATIQGEPVQADKTYTVATIDYLAEGNDKLYSLKHIQRKEMTNDLLRDCLIQYVKAQTAAGKKLEEKIHGQFVINE